MVRRSTPSVTDQPDGSYVTTAIAHAASGGSVCISGTTTPQGAGNDQGSINDELDAHRASFRPR